MTPELSTQPFDVVIVGDRFVPAALMAAGLRRHAEPLGVPLEIREIDLPYPTVSAIDLATTHASALPRAIWESPADIADRAGADGADADIREYTGPVDALVQELSGAEVILTHAAPISRNVIAAADRLVAVGCVRGGPVNVNAAALEQRGIPLFNVSGRNAQAVAEFIIGTLITHGRGINTAAQLVRAGRWSLDSWTVAGAGFELRGKTVGLVGYGRVAQAFTPIANGLGMRILAHDPHVAPDFVVAGTGSPSVPLPELLASSDFVVMMARLTPENRFMIDAAALQLMKQGAMLVNTARAELVDPDALLAALDSGHLAGAILDVFEPEPPLRDYPLLHHPRVLCTPHMAGATRDTTELGADLLGASVAEYLASGAAVRSPGALVDAVGTE